MATLSKPILCNLSIRLPESLKMRLRCGTLSVNDLMDMMIDTLNNLVGKADRNAGAMEEFAGSLVDWADGTGADLDRWKKEAYESLLALLDGSGDAPVRFVLGDGDVDWKHLSEEVQKKINAGGGSGAVPVIDLVIDDHGVITVVTGDGEDESNPCGLIPLISGIAKVYGIKVVNQLVSGVPSDMDTDKVAGLLTMSDWILLQQLANRKEYVLPQASKSAYGGVKVGAGIDVNGGVISTSLDRLGLSLDGDVLTINGKSFKLTAVENEVEEYVSYSEPEVMSILYGKMDNNGTALKPQSVTFHQKKVTTYSDNREPKEEWIDGNLQTAGATFHYTIEPTAEGTATRLTIDKNTGAVSNGGSVWAEEKTLGKVYCTVDFNGVNGSKAETYAVIKQSAAALSVSPVSITTDSNATKAKYFTITKSKTVTLQMTTDGGNWVTPGTMQSNGRVYLDIKENTDTEERQATISVVSNIGTKAVTVKQSGAAVSSYMVYGTCMAVDEIAQAIENGNKVTLTGRHQFSIESDAENRAKVHFVALTNDGEFDITETTDVMGSPIVSGVGNDEVKTIEIGNMKVWYMYRAKYILNTTNVVVNKN